VDDVDALRAQVEKLSQELEIVRGNRDSILREKRVLEGRMTIDRAEVRSNPRLYAQLKQEAARRGVPLAITDVSVPQSAQLPDRFETEETVYVSRDHVGRDVARYRRLQAEAKQAGKQFIVVNDARQLPPEALK
jgi:hypothetical protein